MKILSRNVMFLIIIIVVNEKELQWLVNQLFKILLI